ncbi:uncharacterized protein FIBRA_00284 [Fibroporia radiculosa]|uniref:Ribosomal protein S16 n=1 Tax=Fibroporia radiculosa TaxID=599839 RepID=J7RVA9_9APHY|nr:uncharacterized protein FIBRA_00284 [Fibroporia radiculosa]CCL98290.1 predicted protein [Fibroporia radiculosa]
MAVRLRLAMHGPRHNRIFRLVAIEQTWARNAKPIEVLGQFNPRVTPGETTKTVEWSVDRIRYWLGVGAMPSKSVEKLLTLGNIVTPNEHSTPSRSSGQRLQAPYTTPTRNADPSPSPTSA